MSSKKAFQYIKTGQNIENILFFSLVGFKKYKQWNHTCESVEHRLLLFDVVLSFWLLTDVDGVICGKHGTPDTDGGAGG